MRRHLSLLPGAAAVLAALALSSCTTVDPAAATVNGEEIDRAAFEDQLEQYAGNGAYVAQQSLQSIAVVGEGTDSVTADFARGTLQSAILYTLVGQEVDERGLAVEPDVRALAEDLVADTYGDTLEGFSSSFVEDRVEETAELLALVLDLNGHASLAEAKAAAYAEHPEFFEERCISHILTEDLAGAEAVLEQLEDGADFGEVAAEQSADPSAAENEGDLGCYTGGDQSLDPTFLAAAFEAEVGEPTEPVETQFGHHVILVTSADPTPEAEVDAAALTSLALSLSGAPLNAYILDARAEADVSIDARYGRWDGERGVIVEGEVGARPPVTFPVPTTAGG